MTSKLKTHIWGVALIFPAIAIMYWLAADPPSFWIWPLMFAGWLFGAGTIIARHRAGHFK